MMMSHPVSSATLWYSNISANGYYNVTTTEKNELSLTNKGVTAISKKVHLFETPCSNVVKLKMVY